MTKPYTFRVTEIVKVTDGDTAWLRLDVGFRQTILVNLRLLGYDCPERNSGSPFEKAEASRATRVAYDWLSDNLAEHELWVRTEKDPDSFGRWLGDVWAERDDDPQPEQHLGAALRREGLASIWPRRWRSEFDAD